MKKRTDGRYQLSIMIGYNDNGTPKKKVVYGKTQKEVKEKANDVRLKHNMGLTIDSNITLGEWAKVWLDSYKVGVEYNTKHMYNNVVRNYIEKPLGMIKLKDIKTAHLQKIVNDNKDKGRTVKIFHLTVKQIFEQAIMNDLIYRNPALGVKLPVANKKTETRALTESEMLKITSLQLNDKVKCLIYLLLYTGLRRGEVLALSKGDIDFKNMVIKINKSLVFKINKSEIKTPKSKAGYRDVPILAPLKPVLEDYVNKLNTNLLFTCANGHTISSIAYRRLFDKFKNAMGSTDITAKTFRHNYTTILYNADVDDKIAQYTLGHSSIIITRDIYTHLEKQKRDKATEKINLFLTNFD
jgi:integrase